MMCNYNHAHYIDEALQAILDQTFRPLEIIIVDDGSTDNSVEVIEQFAERNSIIRLFRNDKNRGVAFTANRALEITLGDYVFFAAADDKVFPGLFDKSMKLLAQYPHAGFCCGRVLINDEHGQIIGEVELSRRHNGFVPPERIAVLLRRSESLVAGSALILKRTAMLEFGGFKAGLGPMSDTFMDLAIALKYGGCYIQEPLAVWRLTDRNFSRSLRNDWEAIVEVQSNYVKAMRSDEYNDLFPKEYVSFFEHLCVFHRQYAIYSQFQKEQDAFLEDLRRTVPRPTVVDRVILAGMKLWLQTLSPVIKSYIILRSFSLHTLLRKWYSVKHKLMRTK
jgi:glycosyltransferase involved in cell wall biosynthesis